MKENKNFDINKHNNYFSCLAAYVFSFPISIRIKEIYLYFSKYFLVGRIFKITKHIFTILKTGAYVIVIASVFISILPFLITAFVLSVAFTKNRMIRLNKFFKKMSFKKKMLIYFFDDANELTDRNETYVTIAVNKKPTSFVPYLARKIDENYYIISLRYYYSLKKHIIDKRKNDFCFQNI